MKQNPLLGLKHVKNQTTFTKSKRSKGARWSWDGPVVSNSGLNRSDFSSHPRHRAPVVVAALFDNEESDEEERIDQDNQRLFKTLAASKNGDYDRIQKLLENTNFDPGMCDNKLIQLASAKGWVAVIKLLLTDNRVNPAALNNLAIRNASAAGHVKVVRLLLSDARVNPAHEENQAIRDASSNGWKDLVEILLKDHCVDPSMKNNQALRSASFQGHAHVLPLLLSDARVDATAANNEALRMASLRGHVEVVRLLLLDSRVDPTAEGNEAVRFACQQGHLNVIALLLSDRRVYSTCSIRLLNSCYQLVSPTLVTQWMIIRPSFEHTTYPQQYHSQFSRHLPDVLCHIVYDYAFGHNGNNWKIGVRDQHVRRHFRHELTKIEESIVDEELAWSLSRS